MKTMFSIICLSLVKQSHYTDIYRQMLPEKRYDHLDIEMFNVPNIVVDRTTIASATQFVKVQPVSVHCTKYTIC